MGIFGLRADLKHNRTEQKLQAGFEYCVSSWKGYAFVDFWLSFSNVPVTVCVGEFFRGNLFYGGSSLWWALPEWDSDPYTWSVYSLIDKCMDINSNREIIIKTVKVLTNEL